MLSQLRPPLTLLGIFTVLMGLVYPLAITGVAQVVMPTSANGSMISRQGVVVGSALIGQRFTSNRYFHGRPSAAGSDGYDAAASSGSNLGPLSQKLVARVQQDAAALRQDSDIFLPGDAVTASASGLDPHISPDFAVLQVARVAKARGVEDGKVQQLLQGYIRRPVLGIFGEPRVNVLQLNLGLDAALGAPTS